MARVPMRTIFGAATVLQSPGHPCRDGIYWRQHGGMMFIVPGWLSPCRSKKAPILAAPLGRADTMSSMFRGPGAEREDG